MCCIKWRKTYKKIVDLGQGAYTYLAQVTSDQKIWLVVAASGGNTSPAVGATRLWSFPVGQDQDTGGDWKIVPPHQDYGIDLLRLEIKVNGTVSQLRVVSLGEPTLKWLNVTLEVWADNNPVIQELGGQGQSLATEDFLGADGPEEIDLTELEASVSSLQSQLESLVATVQSSTQALTDQLNAETQARIAQASRVTTPVATDVAVTTASLANNATETGTISLGKTALLQQIVASNVCWVRLYSTAAARLADSGRALSTSPKAGLGILSNAAPGQDSAGLTVPITPAHELHNGDTPRTSVIYYSITNQSGGTTPITVTFTVLTLES